MTMFVILITLLLYRSFGQTIEWDQSIAARNAKLESVTSAPLRLAITEEWIKGAREYYGKMVAKTFIGNPEIVCEIRQQRGIASCMRDEKLCMKKETWYEECLV